MPTVISGDTGVSKIQDGVVSNADLMNEAVTYTKMLQSEWANAKNISGYQKLPSGLIIQWGVVTNSPTANSPTAVVFPIAFTTSNIPISNGIQTTNTGAYSWIDSPTTTGFNRRASVANAISRWLAIGY